jgi:hypothetical protein
MSQPAAPANPNIRVFTQSGPNPDINDAGRLMYGSPYIPDSHGAEQRQYRPSQTPDKYSGLWMEGGVGFSVRRRVPVSSIALP